MLGESCLQHRSSTQCSSEETGICFVRGRKVEWYSTWLEGNDLFAMTKSLEKAACGPSDLASGSRLSHSISLG